MQPVCCFGFLLVDLLGIGDESRLLNRTHDVVPMLQQSEHREKPFEGSFTLRKLHAYFQSILMTDPSNQVMHITWIVAAVL